MPRNISTSMGFPRFKGAVRNLVLFNLAVFIVLLVLESLRSPLLSYVLAFGELSHEGIRHGFVWQFFTYGFLHLDPFNFLLSMLGIYFIGTAVEDQVGARRFYELYLLSLAGAGLIGILLGWTGQIAQGPAAGSGPAANAILLVFYFLFRQARVMPMFIPIPIPVKYIVIFTAAVEAAYLLLSRFSLFMLVQLLGMAVGWAWYRALWRHSILGMLEDQIVNLRNGYYRWKRRRAARKFQVYMRKHEHDPKQYFDEYGNFKPPDDKDNKKDKGTSSGGWIN
jgi:membrane associated rhomboid family serine protease